MTLSFNNTNRAGIFVHSLSPYKSSLSSNKCANCEREFESCPYGPIKEFTQDNLSVCNHIVCIRDIIANPNIEWIHGNEDRLNAVNLLDQQIQAKRELRFVTASGVECHNLEMEPLGKSIIEQLGEIRSDIEDEDTGSEESDSDYDVDEDEGEPPVGYEECPEKTTYGLWEQYFKIHPELQYLSKEYIREHKDASKRVPARTVQYFAQAETQVPCSESVEEAGIVTSPVLKPLETSVSEQSSAKPDSLDSSPVMKRMKTDLSEHQSSSKPDSLESSTVNLRGTMLIARAFAEEYIKSGGEKCLDEIMNSRFRDNEELRTLVKRQIAELELALNHALYLESDTKFGEGTYKGFCKLFGEAIVEKHSGGSTFLKPNQVIRKGDNVIFPYRTGTTFKVTEIEWARQESRITLEDTKNADTVLTLSIAELANVICNNADIPGSNEL